jgi:hypothetical protein
MLKTQRPYEDLGADYFDKRSQDVVVKQAVKRLEKLGYTVTLDCA